MPTCPGTSCTDGILPGFGGPNVQPNPAGSAPGEGSVILTGGSGDSVPVGGGGVDILSGGDGNDTPVAGRSDAGGAAALDGKAGSDTLFGGVGGDRFALRPDDAAGIVADCEDRIDTPAFDRNLWGGGLTLAQAIDRFASTPDDRGAGRRRGGGAWPPSCRQVRRRCNRRTTSPASDPAQGSNR